MSSSPTASRLSPIFWFLVVGTFINRLGSFLHLFLVYYLTERRGFSKEQAGIVVALYGAGALFAGPLGGFLADRLGRRKSMLFATVVGASAMLQLGFASLKWHIMLSAFLLGVLGDLYRPAVNAAIADLVPPLERSRAYGWNYWAANLGFSGASVLGGLLTGVGFTWLFVVDAATTIVFGLLILIFIPEIYPNTPVATVEVPQKRFSITKRLKEFFPYWDKVFISFLLTQLLLEFILYQGNASLPLHMKERGISARSFGLLMGINGALIVILQPWLREKTQSMKRAHVLCMGAVLMGIGFGMNLLPTRIPLVAVSVVIWTVGEILMFCMVPPIISDLAPVNLRGAYQGGYQLTVATSAFLAPLLGTVVLHRLGSVVLWGGCIFLGLGAGTLHLLIAPIRRRRLQGLYESTGYHEDGINPGPSPKSA